MAINEFFKEMTHSTEIKPFDEACNYFIEQAYLESLIIIKNEREELHKIELVKLSSLYFIALKAFEKNKTSRENTEIQGRINTIKTVIYVGFELNIKELVELKEIFKVEPEQTISPN